MSARTALRVVSSPELVAKPRRRRSAKGPVEQLRDGFRPQSRLATMIGLFLGGFVPLASFVVAHYEVDRAALFTAWQPQVLLVLAGLIYSAKTVYDWGKLAFRIPAKAFGFVVLLEGVMVTSSTRWLSFGALAYLILINAFATGCNLSRQEES